METNKNFGYRLKLAMELRDKKAIQIADGCDISRGLISQYLSGKRKPKTEQVVKIAKYLRVAPAFLLGLTDEVFIPIIQPLNSLSNNPNYEQKKALLSELNEILSQQDIEHLKTMLSVIRTLSK